MMGRASRKSGMAWFVVCALLAVSGPLSAGFFLWLDSPNGRINPFDPKSPNHPSNTAPAPLATPTPLPGLTMHLKDSNGNLKAGFLVMLGNSVTTTAVTDALGSVNFPSAVFPADLHVISPWSQSLTAGCVTSYVGITFSPIDLYLVGQTSLSAIVTEQITRTAGTDFSIDRYVGGSGGYGGGGESGGPYSCSPPVPMQYYTSGFSSNLGQTVNFSEVEFDCSWTPVAAVFVPQQILPASGLTITAQTALTGFNTAFTNATPSNTAPWDYIIFDGLCGNSRNDCYNVIGQDLSVSASTTLPWAYLPGFSYFEMSVYGSHDYGGGENANARISVQNGSPAATWNPVLPPPARILQMPTQALPTFIFDRDPSMSPAFGVISMGGWTSQFQWFVVVQCGACPSTYSFSLPALPATAPPQYAFQSGETVGANIGFYVSNSVSLWTILQNQNGVSYFPEDLNASKSGAW